ncbi:MAG: hypothetical protein KKI16_10125, partial [Alphaproteobacteria bacterium]|nr:hypothetical protein [Alphaproteobacteria bacterium]
MEFLNGLVFLTNFVIVPALAYGAQLAIGALGVTLVYAILRFSNFAHGDTMAFGTAVTIKGDCPEYLRPLLRVRRPLAPGAHPESGACGCRVRDRGRLRGR